jgi:hypothetical protein
MRDDSEWETAGGTAVLEFLGVAEVTREVREDADEKRSLGASEEEGAPAFTASFEK